MEWGGLEGSVMGGGQQETSSSTSNLITKAFQAAGLACR